MRHLALVALTGCLEVASGPPQECSTSSDCNAGEVCQEGTCWGDPPPGTFAATITPPAVRDDLVANEIPSLVLPQDGWLGDLTLDAPVTISGRVEAACPPNQSPCSTLSIAAQVRITRPSRFAGGPAVRLSATSKADLPRGVDSFKILVPRTMPGDPPYKVTIDPDGGGELPPSHGGMDPAERVPPKRFTVDASSDLEHQTYVLGSATPAMISGSLKDSLGSYLTSYRVVALGRWDLTSTPSEVSSVCFSTDGTYSIQLSEGLVGPIELVARPYSDVIAPELHVANVEPYGPQTRNIAQPSGLGSRVDLAIRVEGQPEGGAVLAVPGARVQISSATATSFSTGVQAVMADDVITGGDGVAHLSVLDGSALASTYRLNVVPPAGSKLGVLYGTTVPLTTTVTALRLPIRPNISSTIVDATGKPLTGVSVTARRSLRFLWSLEGAEQTFLNEIPAATAITSADGRFALFVDPSVASAWGHYDIYFEPPEGSTAPRWLIPDFEIPRIPDQMAIDLDDVTIPDAAYLHGKIVDAAGKNVDGSTLRLFLLSRNDSVCQEVFNAPEECADDAKVMGQDQSDDNGIVEFKLPRP